MTVRDLNRAVARVTGECVDAIDRRGFQLLEDEAWAESGPAALDWDLGRATALADLLPDDDWPGRVEPLPTYDETYGEEEFAGAAA